MFEKVKKWFKKENNIVGGYQPATTNEKVKDPPKNPSGKRKKKLELSEKELATKNNEPYVNIIKVDIDPNNINNGAFELDWNDKFIINLIKSGYKIKETDTENEIVDRWFQNVCRNIALEIYEQVEADPRVRDDLRVVKTRDIGNGRTEVS
jgi:hypothetical protein